MALVPGDGIMANDPSPQFLLDHGKELKGDGGKLCLDSHSKSSLLPPLTLVYSSHAVCRKMAHSHALYCLS